MLKKISFLLCFVLTSSTAFGMYDMWGPIENWRESIEKSSCYPAKRQQVASFFQETEKQYPKTALSSMTHAVKEELISDTTVRSIERCGELNLDTIKWAFNRLFINEDFSTKLSVEYSSCIEAEHHEYTLNKIISLAKKEHRACIARVSGETLDDVSNLEVVYATQKHILSQAKSEEIKKRLDNIEKSRKEAKKVFEKQRKHTCGCIASELRGDANSCNLSSLQIDRILSKNNILYTEYEANWKMFPDRIYPYE